LTGGLSKGEKAERKMKCLVLLLLIPVPLPAGHKPKWPALADVPVIQVKAQGHTTNTRDLPDYHVIWRAPQSELCQVNIPFCNSDLPETQFGHRRIRSALDFFSTSQGRRLVVDCGGVLFKPDHTFDAQWKGSKLVVRVPASGKHNSHERIIACVVVDN
jgi:hypothetical protein